MPEAAVRYAYKALDKAGRRIAGELTARDEDAAFDALKARGLLPTDVAPVRLARKGAVNVRDRDLAAFVSDLAALLDAGADIRMALSTAAPASKPGVTAIARQIKTGIAGGGSLEKEFTSALPARHAFVGALVAAGSASGDVARGLERAGELMERRLESRDRLIAILAYPTFVLIAAVLAFFVILLVVVPSLAPLANQPGAEPGAIMGALIGLSTLLQENGLVFLGLAAASIVIVTVAAFTGALVRPIDGLWHHGPFRKTAASLTYGAFAVSLGGLLAAGAPMTEALRLSLRTTRSPTARAALDNLLKSVRQGERLSVALRRIGAVPDSIVQLAVVGEESAALGRMLVRAGRFEESAALRKIEAGARVAGPVLIIALGGLIGLMMAGLLGGISDLGEAALN